MSSQPLNTFAAFEAQAHFPELLEKVASGEEIIITEHGQPVARIVPVARQHTQEERRDAIRRIQELQKGLSLGDLKIRDLIEEGRR
ncbi:MAG: type II toxin-antitoxin system prevent-host-death family antitoxin [Pirellulales bacterium]|nr:type II toxin-antitoxin system prevent-host-death family antitoxin [Pirellulales bacterium]